jgi:DNA-directed RNA polymerase specialized sigma subunit
MARKTKKFTLSKQQQLLASENINLARREAWRLQRTTDIDYGTLEGAALEGLCKAAYRYDPESGYKFSSLAVPTIRGELLHWVRDKTYAVRLTHKMRENWLKGRKMLYQGFSETKICQALDLERSEWQEIVSVCSGPPLEINDQANPSLCPEPDEIDFASRYLYEVEETLKSLTNSELSLISNYFKGSNSRSGIALIKGLWQDLETLAVDL